MADRRREKNRDQAPLVIILAAGKGTRMRSSLPKVLHTLRGACLLDFSLRLARSLRPERILVVLGHRSEMVRTRIGEEEDLAIIHQEPQLGTGHAVASCLAEIEGRSGPVVVLSGDVPSLRTETVAALLSVSRRTGAAMTLLTALLPDPRGYGRVLRDGKDRIVAIREQKDLAPGQKGIREANMGIYAFSAGFLREELPRLSADNAQREYYLTDLVEAAVRRGLAVAASAVEDPGEAMGINTMEELAVLEATMRKTYLRKLMDSGVRIIDPDTTYVDETVRVEPEAVLHPMTFLHGDTVIGRGTVVHPGCIITDSRIAGGAEIRPHSVLSGVVVEKNATVGPFAHLRPGTHLHEGAKVGNFVEVKKSVIGRGSKASHLSYIGDARLGEGVNVGAGTITCNFDGYQKNPTVIEDGVFIGSGAMLVAPLLLGKGSIVGAGSTITQDVPEDALAIARAKQENKDGWAARRRQTMGKRSE